MKRLGWLFFALLLAGCGPSYEFRGTLYDPVVQAPEITGLQGDGTDFRLSELKDTVKVVFFGYTFCPDVCPLTLENMRMAYEQLKETERQRVAVVFVSMDPERDTPQRLATYVDAFNPSFYGVHVPLDGLPALKEGYRIYAEKRHLDDQQSAADYLIDHTAAVFVIDKSNSLREIFPNDAAPADIAADLSHLVSEG